MYYLAHYGVKGQEWGVRRFQFPDGTFTDLGKKKYFNTRFPRDEGPINKEERKQRRLRNQNNRQYRDEIREKIHSLNEATKNALKRENEQYEEEIGLSRLKREKKLANERLKAQREINERKKILAAEEQRRKDQTLKANDGRDLFNEMMDQDDRFKTNVKVYLETRNDKESQRLLSKINKGKKLKTSDFKSLARMRKQDRYEGDQFSFKMKQLGFKDIDTSEKRALSAEERLREKTRKYDEKLERVKEGYRQRLKKKAESEYYNQLEEKARSARKESREVHRYLKQYNNHELRKFSSEFQDRRKVDDFISNKSRYSGAVLDKYKKHLRSNKR